jgi:thioredoxin 1
MDISKPSSLTADSFASQVLASSLPVLVDFTAAWCGPCKMLAPHLEQLAGDWKGKVKIVKLDVDEYPEVAQQYQVMSLPTLILFVNGQPVQRLSGYQPKQRLVKQFSPYI